MPSNAPGIGAAGFEGEAFLGFVTVAMEAASGMFVAGVFGVLAAGEPKLSREGYTIGVDGVAGTGTRDFGVDKAAEAGFRVGVK